MKRRNPRFGCRRIAQQLSLTFSIDFNKDVVRRELYKHLVDLYRALGGGWLEHTGDEPRSGDAFASRDTTASK